MRMLEEIRADILALEQQSLRDSLAGHSGEMSNGTRLGETRLYPVYRESDHYHGLGVPNHHRARQGLRRLKAVAQITELAD